MGIFAATRQESACLLAKSAGIEIEIVFHGKPAGHKNVAKGGRSRTHCESWNYTPERIREVCRPGIDIKHIDTIGKRRPSQLYC